MDVTNDGRHITIKASFTEAAILTEAVRKSIFAYESEGLHEFADQAEQLVEELTNNQRIIKY